MKNVYTETLLSSPPRFLRLSKSFKSLNLIGFTGKHKIWKKYIEVFSEIIRRMKLKLGIHAQDITLYKSYVLVSLSGCFSCYAKVYIDFYKKSKKLQFLVSQLTFYINADRVVLNVSYDLCTNRLI